MPHRTKIVCTLGPATDGPGELEALLAAGMDVARLNFSHGSHQEHARRLRSLRAVAASRNRIVAVIQDLQGPKIRTGKLENGKPVELQPGTPFTITTQPIQGNERRVSVSYAGFPGEVSRGNSILISDGLIELKVVRVRGSEVDCRVINGGELRERQGINLPGVALKVSALSEKDRLDLEFGIKHRVDYVALSFVRRPEDVLELKRILARRKHPIPVIAKLEKPEAIDCLEEILRVSDAVMVARGDLGVELPPERVPVIQKQIIAAANALRVPVITATQMLESMTVSARPTRAEASDVANAIFDGSDAVMLSAETATGRYPRESVQMMARIIAAAEASQPFHETSRMGRAPESLTVPEAICESAARISESLQLKAIAVFTQSGSSARVVSKYRPRAPVYAFSPLPQVLRRSALYWGVTPVHMGWIGSTDEMVAGAARQLRRLGIVKHGDLIAIVAGTPIARRGTTNLLKIHRFDS